MGVHSFDVSGTVLVVIFNCELFGEANIYIYMCVCVCVCVCGFVCSSTVYRILSVDLTYRAVGTTGKIPIKIPSDTDRSVRDKMEVECHQNEDT